LDIRGTILHKSLQILAYADDYIIDRYERTVKKAYTKLKKAAQQIGLAINQEKTKFMEVSNSKTKQKYITIYKKNIEKVNEFLYLGSIVTCDKNINVEINHTITGK
jgi:glutamyl-tRNA reductase